MDTLTRNLLDAIPDPVLVVDADVTILEYNKAATDLVGESPGTMLRRRGGDALHCINAATQAGCGRSPACLDCRIRNSVGQALAGQRAHRALHELSVLKGQATQQIHLLVTAARFEVNCQTFALLILEDVTELVALRRIAPICAWCRKVRDDKNYWQDVESYVRRQLAVDFTHGICPECAQQVIE